MKVYVLMQYTDYVGFGLTEDVVAEAEPYDPTIVTIVEVASSESEDTARKLLDYFTHLLLAGPHKPMTEFGITTEDQYTLTAVALESFNVQAS